MFKLNGIESMKDNLEQLRIFFFFFHFYDKEIKKEKEKVKH